MRKKTQKLIRKEIDERLRRDIGEIQKLKEDVQSIEKWVTQEKKQIKDFISEINILKINMPLEGVLYKSKNWEDSMNDGLRYLDAHVSPKKMDYGLLLYSTKTLVSDQIYICRNGFVFGALKVIGGKGSFDLVAGNRILTHFNFVRGDKYYIFLRAIVLLPDYSFLLKSSEPQSKNKLRYSLVGLISEYPRIEAG